MIAFLKCRGIVKVLQLPATTSRGKHEDVSDFKHRVIQTHCGSNMDLQCVVSF